MHPIHLNPQADFYPHVLVPGDPARAMAIATAQLTEPRMFNHRRGLWGYSGKTPAGTGVVVQSTGMGGPSAAIVCEELCDLGAELLLRVGTCGAISSDLALGDLVVVTDALRIDGASRALTEAHNIAHRPEQSVGASAKPVTPDAELTELLVESATAAGVPTHAGRIATVDLFYDPAGEATHNSLLDRGALAVEMEAAVVLTVAARREVRGACLLLVTDTLRQDAGRDRLPHERITELGDLLGLVGVRAVEALLAGEHARPSGP